MQAAGEGRAELAEEFKAEREVAKAALQVGATARAWRCGLGRCGLGLGLLTRARARACTPTPHSYPYPYA